MIPKTYMGATMQVLLARCTPKLRAVIERYDGRAPFPGVFLGRTGVGKSSGAAWLARRWLEANDFELEQIRMAEPGYSASGGHYTKEARVPHRFAWVDAVELAHAERRYKLGDPEPLLIECASNVRWLVLDDVGYERDTSGLVQVLHRRYSRQLPTLVTSGLTKQELSVHLGAPMVRRMAEYLGQPTPMVDLHA